MRYRPLVIVFAFLIILQGCARKQEKVPDTVVNGFEANISVDYQDNNYEAKITRIAPGQCKIEMTKPLLLKGMTFEWNGSEVLLSYLGMKHEVSPATMPNAAFGDAIVKVLDAVSRVNGLDIKKDEGGLQIKGSTDAGPFVLSVDKDTGEIASLSLPSINLTVVFKDFKNL